MGVQVFSFNYMNELPDKKKISKILEVVKSGDIVLIEGRLSPTLEFQLTNDALLKVNENFSGIEIAHLSKQNDLKKPDSQNQLSLMIDKLKNKIVDILAKDRFGISVIGPSKIIKEIKMDPKKLEIMFNEKTKVSKTKSKNNKRKK